MDLGCILQHGITFKNKIKDVIKINSSEITKKPQHLLAFQNVGLLLFFFNQTKVLDEVMIP